MSLDKPRTPWAAAIEAGHGPNWRKWLGHLVGQPANALELGTWRAESAEWFLDEIFTNAASRFWTVDTFEGSAEHKLAGEDTSDHARESVERLARFGPRANVFKGYTHEAMLGILRDERFDFIYVDAAHDAMNVLRDGVLAFELLEVGGIMVFDDYEWKVMEQEVDRPKLAIDAFLACYARRIEVIGLGWQVAIRKIQ